MSIKGLDTLLFRNWISFRFDAIGIQVSKKQTIDSNNENFGSCPLFTLIPFSVYFIPAKSRKWKTSGLLLRNLAIHRWNR